jgi:hypothetical protein
VTSNLRDSKINGSDFGSIGLDVVVDQGDDVF